MLVVDDNETNRKLLHALFRGHQMGTVDASDGVEALEALRQNEIDVIVSDILMPNMDGFRLCFEVRHDQRLKDVGVILYTATDFTAADERRAFDLGADRFLKKEGSTTAILTAVRETACEIQGIAKRHLSIVHEYPELEVMKEYSQAMILKLENKSVELENAKEELRKANEVLEQRVKERTSALELVNQELESFSYSVSHDLRAPLRWIDAYSGLIEEECAEQLDAKAKGYLDHIKSARHRMSHLIEDLLALSRVTRTELRLEEVDLSELAGQVINRIAEIGPEGGLGISIEPDMVVRGDPALLRIVLENLLDNAWKYTSKVEKRRIVFGRRKDDEKIVYFVQDNGAGFDMAYAQKLFGAFQRLHSEAEFPGIGVGLATVKRIIHRHGGEIWAQSVKGDGATFNFTVR